MSSTQIKLLVLDVDGTLTDGGIYISESGEQWKKFNVKDGMGIVQVQKQGIEVGIISHSSSTGMVNKRANMLNLNFLYVGKEPKLKVLNTWIRELEITSEQVAFVGDDINDLDIIAAVGLSACPADAHDLVKSEVNHILRKNGGYGAVREFIDDFLLSGE